MRASCLLPVAIAAVLLVPCAGANPRSDGMTRANVAFETALADTNDIVNVVGDTLMTVRPGGQPLRIPYFSNRLLDASYPDVDRAILVICGTLRNADDYYHSVMDAAALAGGADSHTLILAPQFLVEGDIAQHDLPSDILYWAYYGWRRGDQSLDSAQHPRPARISSFAVADTILIRLAQLNPNLRQIVVAGHSAGGQFSNLYAAGSRVEEMITSQYGIAIRHIVSNPSCYIYFSDERWIRGTYYTFATPTAEQIADCPDYNHYKYGLEYPNEYMAIGSDRLIQQYGTRQVIYLLGGADTNPSDFYLDTSCPAEMEGSQRLERGTVYWHFVGHFFGEGIYDIQKLAVVPGVGHNQRGMFTSQCGVFYLFDYGTCPDAPPPDARWIDTTPTIMQPPYFHSAAWGDYDGDGRPDLYLPAVSNPSRLIHNEGRGSFADVSSPPVNDAGHGMTAAWGDYDNDGRSDLYLVHWQSANRLFQNDGTGFSDVTSSPLAISGDCTGATWVDYDNDGDLDLYVTRTSGQSNVMLRNGGAGGFTNASAPPLDFAGNTRSAAWGDFDADGDADVYIVADPRNKLLRNEGGGHFTDVTNGPLANNADGSAGAWGDYDNDQDLDLYVVNRNDSNRLLRNEGDGSFTDVTSGPLGMRTNGRAATWGDYDNDGLLDIFITNGTYPNRLLRNLGDSAFADSTVSPLDGPGNSYCSAWADYDGDGAIDLFSVTSGGSSHLIRNVGAAAGNHWLEVDLVGTVSNRSAIGARATVYAAGLVLTRQVGGDAAYLAQNSPTLEFGLASALEVDSLAIRWPSGIVQTRRHFEPDQHLTIFEWDGPEDVSEIPPVSDRLRASPNPFRGSTEIHYWVPGRGEVALTIHDLTGRVVRALPVDSRIGQHRVIWDGETNAGRRAPDGLYFCRLAAGGKGTTLRVIVLKP